MRLHRLTRAAAVLGACTLGCRTAQPPDTVTAPSPSVTPPPPAPTPTATPTSLPAPPAPTARPGQTAIRAPGADWEPIKPERARGYASIFFGSGAVKDTGMLRPLAAWKRGER